MTWSEHYGGGWSKHMGGFFPISLHPPTWFSVHVTFSLMEEGLLSKHPIPFYHGPNYEAPFNYLLGACYFSQSSLPLVRYKSMRGRAYTSCHIYATTLLYTKLPFKDFLVNFHFIALVFSFKCRARTFKMTVYHNQINIPMSKCSCFN